MEVEARKVLMENHGMRFRCPLSNRNCAARPKSRVVANHCKEVRELKIPREVEAVVLDGKAEARESGISWRRRTIFTEPEVVVLHRFIPRFNRCRALRLNSRLSTPIPTRLQDGRADSMRRAHRCLRTALNRSSSQPTSFCWAFPWNSEI